MEISVQTIIATAPLIITLCGLMISAYDCIRGFATGDKKRSDRAIIALMIFFVFFIGIVVLYGLEA